MLRAERQAFILQYIRDYGYVKTEKLIELLDVSHVTLRRDLIALSEQNLVNLEHGGATRIDYLDGIAEPMYGTKLFMNSDAKNIMCDIALDYVRNGDILVLDSGTTNFLLAQKLKTVKLKSLTVITSDIMVAKELSSQSNISVLMLGGILRKSYFNVYGPFTEQILSQLKANRLFMGFDGASLDRGLSLNLLEEVPAKQMMIQICDEVIAFGDSEKYKKDAPYLVCGWDKVTHVIVEKQPPHEFLKLFQKKDIVVEMWKQGNE